jgi:predicted membrane-bound spermidine synthase
MPAESLKARVFLPAVFALFTASGFAGLIYESIWSHYLKLFLGHAAYAQTLVLAIFMGGMALGAWAASRASSRLRDLLLAYAVIEALIGIASLAFHATFVAATAFAFDRVIPSLGSPAAVYAFKWTLAAVLILPQSVLLGMTFPLMTGGVLRLRPERSGYAIAMLYFANSLGAAAGVLTSGFYLIAAVGLPGTLIAAAILNFVVAAAVILLPKPPAPAAAQEAAPAAAAGPVPRVRLLLAIAALTGMSSFMYEIGWIRMLALVLGSSTLAFELMLSAFILGIACGGLWVRRRIDAARDTLRLLGVVQVAMGLAALATLPVYGSVFYVMQFTVRALAHSDGGYAIFNLISHGISLSIMFPAAFCAGMTLPLLTASLLRAGAGERAIGQVYAANTAGAIVGVIAAVHLGLPLLGLKGLIVAGALVDLALGVVLLGLRPAPKWAAVGAGALSLAAVTLAVSEVHLDAHRMASGVFRLGTLLNPERDKVLLQIDGKTATVSVTAEGDALALRTNGKSDAAIRIGGGEPAHDEVTMTLIGALPQFLAPRARRVANIGFGTGLTAHVLLASDHFEVVDTVEIEPAIVHAAASHFRPRNARALDDPRSHVYFDDAKTYFSAQHARYDVIVSEPSNPWVSGVATLFSTEFYRDIRRHLTDEGLLFQWVQIYEMSPELLATVVAALHANFADYEVWLSNHGDVIIVASPSGRVPPPDAAAFGSAPLRAELERFHIRNLDDLLFHRVGGRAELAAFFGTFGVQPNSDFFPVLDLQAPRARFMRLQTEDLAHLLAAGFPALELFDTPKRARADALRMTPGARFWLRPGSFVPQAVAAHDYLLHGNVGALAQLPSTVAGELSLVRASLVECTLRAPPAALRDALAEVGGLINERLARRDRDELWALLRKGRCPDGAHQAVRPWLDLYAAIGAADPQRMVDASQALLLPGAAAPRDLFSMALAANMSGRILMSQPAAAMRAFNTYRGAVAGSAPGWQPVFRFLVGQTSR